MVATLSERSVAGRLCAGGGFYVTRYAIPPDAGVAFVGRKTYELHSPTGRITIPGPWRSIGEVYLLPDATETFLRAMPTPLFMEVADRIVDAAEVTAEELEVFRRFYFSSAVRTGVDNAGRITIPPEFCRLLDLQGDVLLLGTLESFEIWNPQRFREYLTALRKETT